jgi:hypothetical protein
MTDFQKTPQEVPLSNPLAGYYRQPKIFIRLPSEGSFYPPGSLDISQTGEYAVYAMTAKDELMFKTPDALINGQATVEVIKSCVPAIRDPWKMPSLDVDAVLIAIRVATYGQEMDVNADCPKCFERNDYVFNLVTYLHSLSSFKFTTSIEVGPLTVNIRPYSYSETTKSSIKAIEQKRIFDIVNDDDIDEEEKLSRFSNSFIKLTELTVDVISGCITSIVTPEGEVSDAKLIAEFINNAPSDVFNKINEHVVGMKNDIEMSMQHVRCQSCDHEFDVNLTIDQSNFFDVRS